MIYRARLRWKHHTCYKVADRLEPTIYLHPTEPAWCKDLTRMMFKLTLDIHSLSYGNHASIGGYNPTGSSSEIQPLTIQPTPDDEGH